MAQSTSSVSGLSAVIVTETSASSTPNTDVRAGATTVYQVDIDNTLPAAATFVKLYDAASPSVGTTAPDYILKIASGKRKVFTLALDGVPFTNLSFAAVTAGGTAGTGNPSAACPVRILCT